MTTDQFHQALALAATKPDIFFFNRSDHRGYIFDCTLSCPDCHFSAAGSHCRISECDSLDSNQLTYLQSHHPDYLI